LAVTEDSVELSVSGVSVDNLPSTPNRDLLLVTAPTVVEGLVVVTNTGLVEDE